MSDLITSGWLVECQADVQPVLQVLKKGIHRFKRSGVEKDYINLHLSDGKYTDDVCYALNTLKATVESMKINSILKLTKFVTSYKSKQDVRQRMLVVHDLEILREHSTIIGTPVLLNVADKGGEDNCRKIIRDDESTASSSSSIATTAGTATVPTSTATSVALTPGSSTSTATVPTAATATATTPTVATHHISDLKIGLGPNWTIRAKITYVSDKLDFMDGHYLYANLMDERGKQIRLVAYHSIIDKFLNQLKVNHSYLFKKCELKKVVFQTYENVDYDIILTDHSELVELVDFTPPAATAQAVPVPVPVQPAPAATVPLRIRIQTVCVNTLNGNSNSTNWTIKVTVKKNSGILHNRFNSGTRCLVDLVDDWFQLFCNQSISITTRP